MFENIYSKAISAVSETDLGLDPDFSAPWMGTVRDISGYVVGTLFVVSGILLAIGIFQFLIAKSAGNSRGQDSGVKNLILGLIGVVALGSVGALIVFAGGFNPFG